MVSRGRYRPSCPRGSWTGRSHLATPHGFRVGDKFQEAAISRRRIAASASSAVDRSSRVSWRRSFCSAACLPRLRAARHLAEHATDCRPVSNRLHPGAEHRGDAAGEPVRSARAVSGVPSQGFSASGIVSAFSTSRSPRTPTHRPAPLTSGTSRPGASVSASAARPAPERSPHLRDYESVALILWCGINTVTRMASTWQHAQEARTVLLEARP